VKNLKLVRRRRSDVYIVRIDDSAAKRSDYRRILNQRRPVWREAISPRVTYGWKSAVGDDWQAFDQRGKSVAGSGVSRYIAAALGDSVFCLENRTYLCSTVSQ